MVRMLGVPVIRKPELSIHYKDGQEQEIVGPIMNFFGGLPVNFSTHVLGRYENAGKATVSLSGLKGKQPYSRSWNIQLPAYERANGALAKLWARARIGQLQGVDLAQEEQEVSLKYGVLAKSTAWLVLESEAMYRDFNIRRVHRRIGNDDELRARILAGTPVAPAARRLDQPGRRASHSQLAAQVTASAGLNVLGQVIQGPIEIEGVMVEVSLSKATIVARPQASKKPSGRLDRQVQNSSKRNTRRLAPRECRQRRQVLSRPIAAARGLPFEPEVVFPLQWLQLVSSGTSRDPAGLNQAFAPNADALIWALVEKQPIKAVNWRPFTQHSTAEEFQIDQFMNPDQPSRFEVSEDERRLKLYTSKFAHDLFSALLTGKSTGMQNATSPTTITHMVRARAERRYLLEGVRPNRLAAAWTFLAETALVEGQARLAADHIQRALKALGLDDEEVAQRTPARLSYLIQALAIQISGDPVQASECYENMLKGSQPLEGLGRDLAYTALMTSMAQAGNLSGAISVMEKWCYKELNKARYSDQMGRCYMIQARPDEAIRAFSTVAEFVPATALKYPKPEAFLEREQLVAPVVIKGAKKE